jgi:hypothetical protein
MFPGNAERFNTRLKVPCDVGKLSGSASLQHLNVLISMKFGTSERCARSALL